MNELQITWKSADLQSPGFVRAPIKHQNAEKRDLKQVECEFHRGPCEATEHAGVFSGEALSAVSCSFLLLLVSLLFYLQLVKVLQILFHTHSGSLWLKQNPVHGLIVFHSGKLLVGVRGTLGCRWMKFPHVRGQKPAFCSSDKPSGRADASAAADEVGVSSSL